MNSTELFLSILIKQVRARDCAAGTKMPASSWITDFRTVTLGVPRCSGKTNAVITLATKHPSLVLAPTRPMAQLIGERYKGPVWTVDEMRKLSTPSRSTRFHFSASVGAKPIELLLVDEGTSLKQEDRRLVSDLAVDLCLHGAADPNTLVVVLIGT